MSWEVVSRQEVSDDLAAAAWYNERQPGLGDEFLNEVTNARNSLSQNPYLNSQRHRTKRFYLRNTKRFPYYLVYQVFKLKKLVVVIAVVHSARHERRWRKRLV